jgi:hypothetical protein
MRRTRMFLATSIRWLRMWAVLAVFGLLLGFAGLVLAAGPQGDAPVGSVRDHVYQPGEGCGDRNHVHVPKPAQNPCPPEAGPND